MGSWKGRAAAFIGLAVLLATANTYGSTLAASLFLSRAGAEGIPLYYMLYAVVSVPITVAFTRLIDRWPRQLLFSLLLLAGAVITGVVAPMAAAENIWLFFSLYIVISVFEQLSYSIYYVLIGDYFTSVEVNRSASGVALGMAIGGLLGGALAGIASEFYPASTLLYGMPALLLVTAGLFAGLKRTVRPLGDGGVESEEGLRESLRSIGPLIGRYPVVGLLALGVFLNIVVQSFTEYQVFIIYADSFPDEQELTRFLGYINGALNLINIVTSIIITAPLMRWLGVARMNLVYPALATSAFAGLGVSFSLPAAVFAHVVYDPWVHSIDAPVFMSNYNAIPHRFAGRVRVLNDGLVYPLAMAAVGGALMVMQRHLPQSIITGVGLALALAFLLCGFAIRRAYSSGLMEMLRSGSLDLSQAGTGLGAVPQEHLDEVRSLLTSTDPTEQSLGLELAARAEGHVFTREIEDLLGQAVAPVRAAFLHRYAAKLSPKLAETVTALLDSEDAAVRAQSLEALVIANHAFDPQTWHDLLKDPAPQVAAIAHVGAWRAGIVNDNFVMRSLNAGEKVRLRALQVIQNCADPKVYPLLSRLRIGGSAAVQARILDIAAGADMERTLVSDWIDEGLAHDDAHVRAAAFRLLGKHADATVADRLAAGLADPVKEVRLAAAAALGHCGAVALPAVRRALERRDPAFEEAAIEAAGHIGGPVADDVLYRHLISRHFANVRRNIKWDPLESTCRHASLSIL